MIPHKGLLRHDPGNGTWGDCFRTAVACMLDLHPSEVPHVFEGGRHAKPAMARMRHWLEENHGLTLIEIPFDFELPEVLAWAKTATQDVHYLLTGTSGLDCGHTVVCHRDKIVHDPSPHDTGIVGPVEGFYWLGFLVRAI